MKHKINITIKTTQDSETSIWESQGLMEQKDGAYVVTYPDYTGNTVTDNILELNPDSMRIRRSGAIDSDMIFEENMVTSGVYGVMFYKTNLEIITMAYDFIDRDYNLQASADYKLLDAGSEIADNRIEISVVAL